MNFDQSETIKLEQLGFLTLVKVADRRKTLQFSTVSEALDNPKCQQLLNFCLQIQPRTQFVKRNGPRIGISMNFDYYKPEHNYDASKMVPTLKKVAGKNLAPPIFRLCRKRQRTRFINNL